MVMTLQVRLGWIWLLFAAGAIVVYRGVTQSLTIDEAFAYHLFLKQKLPVLFQTYDAAYHVLHTWACWLVVHRFGKSEAVIRLPSMLAGVAYLAGVGCLCRRVVGDGWRFLVGVVLLSANPLIADYLSAARGYGAALAFFVWAFIALLDHRVVRASVLLGLSVACNLTFVVPIAAAGAVYLAFQATGGERVAPLLRRLVLPFLLTAVPILAVPLWHARGSNFYFGASDLRTSVATRIGPSLACSEPNAPAWVAQCQATVFPLVIAVMMLAGVFAALRRALPAVLAAGSLMISILILLAAHGVLGVPYPWSRSGLYLIWLFLASCVVLWQWAAGQKDRLRWLAPPFAVVSVLLAALFVSEFDTRYYFDFREDAQVSGMMRQLRDLHPTQPECMGGSWPYETTVNYYRLRYKLTWLEEMKRTEQPEAGCRFYMLRADDARFVDQLGLRRLWTDHVSGAILAERTSD